MDAITARASEIADSRRGASSTRRRCRTRSTNARCNSRCRSVSARRSRSATRTRSTSARAAARHVWDVDGHEYVDTHGGFGSMVVGHAHPKIIEAITARREYRLALRGADRRHGAVRRGAVPALQPRAGALRELGHRSDDERDPRRARGDRSRRHREDRRLVPRSPRSGDVLRRAERRPHGRARDAGVGADVARRPEVPRGPHARGAVQRPRPARAAARRARRRRSRA